MDLETRITNLENLVNALSKKIDKNKFYQDADTSSERINISNNTNGVSENDSAICDVAELEDINSSAIDDLAEMIDNLENRVAKLEEQ